MSNISSMISINAANGPLILRPFTPPVVEINGTSARDTLTGSFGTSDQIHGGAGNDVLYGVGGANESDRLYGGWGADVLHAGVGTVLVDGGDDLRLVWAPESIDTAVLDFSKATKGVTYVATQETAQVDGGTGLQMTITNIERIEFTGGQYGDHITGTVNNDIIDGGAGNDTLAGGLGNDKLLGGAGGDNLIGGAGRDTLDGGAGIDTLAGGADADTYILRFGESNGDTILGFQEHLDRLELHGYAAGSKLSLRLDADGEQVRGVWDIKDAEGDLLETIYAVAKFSEGDAAIAQNYFFL